MLPYDYLAAVHQVLSHSRKADLKFSSQKSFDSAVRLFGRGRRSQIHLELSTPDSFVDYRYLKSHIKRGIVVADDEVSLFDFVRHNGVRANYASTELKSIDKRFENPAGTLSSVKEIRNWKDISKLLARGPVKIDLKVGNSLPYYLENNETIRIMKERFSPGDNIVGAQYGKENINWIFYSPEGEFVNVDNFLNHLDVVGYVGGEQEMILNSLPIGTRVCPYDGNKLVKSFYSMHGEPHEFQGYQCKQCGSCSISKTPAKERARLEKEMNKATYGRRLIAA